MVRNVFIRSRQMPGAAYGAGESPCPKTWHTDAFDGV
jgi:hypothetical protein